MRDLADSLAEHRLLTDVPDWVRKGLARRLKTNRLTIVSAVCPDYSREDGKLTYDGVSGGLPYTAGLHLELVGGMVERLGAKGVAVSYHVTLADTEFDLPVVMKHICGGDTRKFIGLCQESCQAIAAEAARLGLALESVSRFSEAFPTWFQEYEESLRSIETELLSNGSSRHDLDMTAAQRLSLYEAMAGEPVGLDYARSMVKRQWAQYMAWGRCAEQAFGTQLVMINHSTPNLGRVNHPAVRCGKERIPILQLQATTLPE